MQTAELVNYIQNPGSLDDKSVAKLQKLVSDFPYFQSAHILLSLASKKWDASVYQQSLSKTAIVVNNRSHLFNLVHRLETAPANGLKPEHKTETVTPEVWVGEPAAKAGLQNVEDTKHELDILKATELSVSEPMEEPQAKPTSGTDLSEAVESEMGKQLISAYLEKEILKTPELHNPVKAEAAPASFNDWLHYIRSQGKNASAAPPLPDKPLKEQPKAKPEPQNDSLLARKQKNKALIDKIIESSPGHIRVKDEAKFYTPDNKAKESLQENEHLVTETLARIYELQGNVNKAVRAYEILSLKFPQKSAYFAALIQKLKTTNKDK